MSVKRILVTGAGGFLGSHLSRALATTFPKARVFGIGRKPRPGQPDFFPVDLADRRSLGPIIRDVRPDTVFHLAGVIPSAEWEELFRDNVKTTVNLLDAIRDSGGDPRVVVPGSAAEVGRFDPSALPLTEDQVPFPMTPYGVSKVCQTAIARYYAVRGLQVVVGRIFNVIGKGMPETSSIGSFAAQLRRIRAGEVEPRIAVGNLDAKRDFVDVADVCTALALLAEKGRIGEIYNVCSGKSVSMADVLGGMIRRSGAEAEIIVDPEKVKPADIPDSWGSTDKTAREIGWRSRIPLDQSLRRVLP